MRSKTTRQIWFKLKMASSEGLFSSTHPVTVYAQQQVKVSNNITDDGSFWNIKAYNYDISLSITLALKFVQYTTYKSMKLVVCEESRIFYNFLLSSQMTYLNLCVLGPIFKM